MELGKTHSGLQSLANNLLFSGKIRPQEPTITCRSSILKSCWLHVQAGRSNTLSVLLLMFSIIQTHGKLEEHNAFKELFQMTISGRRVVVAIVSFIDLSESLSS